MYDNGRCWGYGNYKVTPDQVCDSYSPEKAERDGHLKEIEVTDELREAPLVTVNIHGVDIDDPAGYADEVAEELRAAMSSASMNDLPDDAFAYIEPGGEKDEEGKTTPRDKRHFPIHDAAHVRNALARVSQSPFGDKAMPKILAAAKKFGIETEQKSAIRPKKPRRRSGPAVGMEVRHFAATDLEVRDSGSSTIEVFGTPIVYDTAYSVRDMFGEFSETMKPGVVSDLLEKGCDTRFLFNHQGLPLARSSSGTMKMEDTPKGLTFVAQLDMRQSLAADLAIAIERRDITQMSCGFVVADDEWLDNETRNIFRFKALEDISAVTYPASPTTSIDVAQRMLMEAPVESRARVGRMWAITRDLHDGRAVDPSDIDVLSDGLRALAEADVEERDESEVIEVGDLDEETLRSMLADLEERIGKAIGKKTAAVLQGLHDQIRDMLVQNGHDPDKPIVPPGSLAGAQGDQNAPFPSPAGLSDATGSRAAELALELELMEIERRKA